ncbi:hypothetical protein [Streptomyces sp. NPDC050255]|uniref:hypothetical protein n=1 Tax=Streptomyces sp. NPDC050255 TaxID=3365606 RepID=UPI00379D75E7
MKWPDEIRDPAELAPDAVDVDEDEVKRAMELMDSMTTDDISGYRDEYRDALEELIEAKVEGKELPEAAEGDKQQSGEVLDLMAALNASVEKAKESRGESDATVHKMKPRKKAASNKASTKKPAAKKSTGKKAAAGKSKSA